MEEKDKNKDKYFSERNSFNSESDEVDQTFTKDVENQTILQDVPIAVTPIEYKQEASQTISSMNISPMSVFKNNRSSQNIITIAPFTSQNEAAKYLSNNKYEKHREDLEDFTDKETMILEILNFLLSRVIWISDPGLDQVETKCQETQTIIRYDHNADSVVLDNDAQTNLTCEPKCSNSKLLTSYEETKGFMQSCLGKCLEKIESRIIIDDLIEEIIVKGADILKYPTKEQVIQTVTSYNLQIKEEDVLRKLRIPVVVDPFEASIVLAPLMEDFLDSICDEVSRDARKIVKIILDSSIQQAAVIGFKLAEIRKQSQYSTEQILDRRRKRIVESMLKKETETASTQTGLAGVPEVGKFKEPKDILCSICARQSACCWCAETSEDNALPEPTKLLRTQDILLAYNPCYIIATASEEKRNPHLQQTDLTRRKVERSITAQSPISRYKTSKKTDAVTKTVDVLMTPKKNIGARDSLNEWARIMDNTLAKSLSLQDSASNATSVTIMSTTTKSISKSCCERSQCESVPSLQVTKALQILKNTFCIRDACTFLSPRERHSPNKHANEKYMFCNLENCALLNLDQHRSKQHIDNIDNQNCARPRADKFRVAHTRLFPKS